DLVYYGHQGQVEYDFIVAPGATPEVIRWRVQDQGGQALPVHLDAAGDLVVQVGGGEVRLHQPRLYQEIGGVKQPIAGRYVVLPTPEAGPHIGVVVAAYDASHPLIIDPVLSYATYLGGSGDDEVYGRITVDAAGNAYVAG